MEQGRFFGYRDTRNMERARPAAADEHVSAVDRTRKLVYISCHAIVKVELHHLH
ncbi:DUF3929 family protein [Ectobacillus ponti]|uniref:DUF3929 family protein n=1 Tax=Ectobacillus ponti TaxID=2961894 RepID=UPI0034D32638